MCLWEESNIHIVPYAQPPAKFAENQRKKQGLQCYDVSHQTFRIRLLVVISGDFPEFFCFSFSFYKAAGSSRQENSVFSPFGELAVVEKMFLLQVVKLLLLFSFCVLPACWDVSNEPDKTKYNNRKQAQQIRVSMQRSVYKRGTFMLHWIFFHFVHFHEIHIC